MGTQNLPVSVPPIQVDISPVGFLQSNETGRGSTKARGYSSSHIPGRYSTATPVERGAGSAVSTDLPAAQGSGAGRESEVKTDSRPETGVFGFSGRHSQTPADLPSREAEENKAASSTPPLPTEYYSEGHSKVCWEGLSIDTSCKASSPSLQFSTNSVSWHSMETKDMAMKFSTSLILNMEAQNDLKWWHALDRKVQLQSPLLPQVPPSMTIESDASNMGWRA